MADSQITVILPTFNRPEGLKRALESVRAQAVDGLDVVVVNDGGADPAPVVKEFGDLEITLESHPQNRGVAAARNTALALAGGRRIAYLDDDDFWLPGHLEGMARAMDAHKARAAYSGVVRRTLLRDGTSREETLDPGEFDPGLLLVRYFFHTSAVVHEAACLTGLAPEGSAGPFDETLSTMEDWDLWLRMGANCDFCKVDQGLCVVVGDESDPGLQQRLAGELLSNLGRIYSRHRAPEGEGEEAVLRGRGDYFFKVMDHFAAMMEHEGQPAQALPLLESMARLRPGPEVQARLEAARKAGGD